MPTVEELGEPIRKARDLDPMRKLKDGDGDGFVNDGTPQQRPVAADLGPKAVARMAKAFGLTKPVQVTRVIEDRKSPTTGGKQYGLYRGLERGVHRIDVTKNVSRTGALALLAHEMVHARQRERIGSHFMDTYQKLHAVHGYSDNPLEVEARKGTDLFMERLEGREDFFKAKAPRDGDGDGLIFDGTPQERPAFSPASTKGAAGLPVLPWRDPPPPRGKPGQRRAGGMSASGRTVTAQGDLAEKLVSKFGLERAQETRQGALDAIGGGWGYEIKARTVESAGYKVGMRSGDMKKKNATARKMRLKAGLIMIVMDEKAGRAWVYHRAGIANGRLSVETGFHYAGEVKL